MSARQARGRRMARETSSASRRKPSVHRQVSLNPAHAMACHIDGANGKRGAEPRRAKPVDYRERGLWRWRAEDGGARVRGHPAATVSERSMKSTTTQVFDVV